MEIKLSLTIYLISFLLFTTLIYGQCRINTRNSTWFKRLTLSLGGEELIRIVYLIIVISAFIGFLYAGDNLNIEKILFTINIKNIVITLIAFIAFVQILFITVTIVYGVFLKKDINKVIGEIDWLKVDTKRFIYTGYIRILGVALFEVLFFFNFIFNILYIKLDLTLLMSIVITVLYYCYSKVIIRRGKEKNIIFAILGLAIAVPALVLINTVDSLLIGLIFMYIILVMIAFKDIKVKSNYM